MVKVAVVGFGTIGERIGDGLAKQQDMELVGVADVAPTLPVRALVESGRGYSIYCSLPERIPIMEEAGIPIAGTLDDLLEQVDMACDAAPPGVCLGSGIAQDQGDMEGVVEVAFLAEKPMAAEHLAMVAGEDDEGVVVEPLGLQEVQDAADVEVDLSDQAVVNRRELLNLARAEIQEYVTR